MALKHNTTMALTATGGRTSAVKVDKGDLSLTLLGTWAGTITILRRYLDLDRGPLAEGTDDTSTAAATMTNSDAPFTADELIGKYIENVDDGSIAAITDNTTTVVTGTLAGGSNNNWDSGDTYRIWEPIATYTSNPDPQEIITEPVGGAEYMAHFTRTSGTASVGLYQAISGQVD